jgi:hypothetical protein
MSNTELFSEKLLANGIHGALELSSNKTYYKFDETDVEKIVMAMRLLRSQKSDKGFESEQNKLSRKDSGIARLLSDTTIYTMLNNLMDLCEEHFRFAAPFSPSWLRDNMQDSYGGVGRNRCRKMLH